MDVESALRVVTATLGYAKLKDKQKKSIKASAIERTPAAAQSICLLNTHRYMMFIGLITISLCHPTRMLLLHLYTVLEHCYI